MPVRGGKSSARATLAPIAATSSSALPCPAMCRSIRTLRGAGDPVSDEDIRAAALQYVRKLSGYRAPSQRNAAAFEAAVDEVATATRRLLDGLVSR